MRVLFVVDQLPDLVSDLLYLGLARVLGGEGVIDYPSKAIFHKPESRRWFLPQVPEHGYMEERIMDLLRGRAFDLVCMAAPYRAGCLASMERLARVVPLPPVVCIDGADDGDIRHELAGRFSVAAYFKREYRWMARSGARRFIDCARAFRFNRKLHAKTYPLPISVALDSVPRHEHAEKDVGVSFYGHISHPKRARAMALLESLGGEGVQVAGAIYAAPTDRAYKLEVSPVKRLLAKLRNPSRVAEEVVSRKLSPEEYYRVLARSKVAVSIRGGGFDTLRYWEIAASGTLLLSETPDIEIPHNFEHRRHAVFCRSDLSDLQELIRYYVARDEERERIARAGREHVLKFHTCERRAEYFLDVCRRNL
jgi:hypothetical protein